MNPGLPELDAFTLRMTEVQLPLFSYVVTLVANLSDANDVLQETNLALLAKREQYDPARPFWPWACQFARLQALAYSKSRQRERHLFSGELIDLLADEAVEDGAELQRERRALEACLKTVGQRGRELLHLRYHDALSCETIAQKVGGTTASVWTALHRARRFLANCVQQRLANQEGNS
ncbi:MAG: sigma-70 family RNA polymerase sigma factor [Planctomycetes bacterium]|nr:sigma-70 family RNA polymerase sigma factor [Planctomycetota bacterium]